MPENRHFSGDTEEQVWQQLAQDIAKEPDALDYQAVLQQGNLVIALDIDIDLGGGFEGGSELTTLSAPFSNPDAFQFGLHHEGFLDELGKLFGMQDLEIGDPLFDKSVVVKSSDEAKVRQLLSDPVLRAELLKLDDFYVGTIISHDAETNQEQSRLELTTNEGVTDPARLRLFYTPFVRLLAALTQSPL